MLNEFADAEDLPGQAELFLKFRPWINDAQRVVCPVKIPRIESAEVLNRSQHLIASN